MSQKSTLMGAGVAVLANPFPKLKKAMRAKGASDQMIGLLGGDRADGVIELMAATAVEQLRLLCLPAWLQEWVKFYKNVVHMDVDFSRLVVPAEVPTGKWPIVLAQGLTYSQLWEAVVRWEAYRKRPEPYRYADLGTAIKTTDVELLEATHCVFVGSHVEATGGDNHLQLLSAKAIRGHQVQNLMKRLVLDVFVDWRAAQKGKVQLLDQKSWTLTSSRWSGGCAVFVGRRGGQLDVFWSYPQYADPCLRARAADPVV